jgi:hypothetical protein
MGVAKLLLLNLLQSPNRVLDNEKYRDFLKDINEK